MKKTNAARILDRLKIKYDLVEYDVDPNDLSALHLAEIADLPLEQVYKTLVLQGDRNGIFVCVIPGSKEIDLKKAAVVSFNKKAAMIKMKDLEPLTGYIRGGCSPLGMKKNYPIFIDISAFPNSFIYISAGMRGLQIKINPNDLMSAANASKADLTEDEVVNN
jgi:Cys-tRNA(Pro)/Cys-tRNA(Cys) deacylase